MADLRKLLNRLSPGGAQRWQEVRTEDMVTDYAPEVWVANPATDPIPVTVGDAAPATGASSSVSGSTSPQTLSAADPDRVGCTVHNDSTAVLYVLLGAGTVSGTVYTARLVENAYYEVPYGFTGAVTGVWASATGAARVTEITA